MIFVPSPTRTTMNSRVINCVLYGLELIDVAHRRLHVPQPIDMADQQVARPIVGCDGEEEKLHRRCGTVTRHGSGRVDAWARRT